MYNRTQLKRLAVLMNCLLALAACDKIVDQSRAAQSVSKAAFEDTKASWKDFFMYHPPVPDSLPQTRYCYQMQSDVVCYDSEQRQLTSKLVGYQDGENISWTQPGGGSLGASGGEPIALRPMPVKADRVASQPNINTDESNIDTGPVSAGSATAAGHEKWLYDKGNDVYRKVTISSAATANVAPSDAVSVIDLPKGQ